MEKESERIIRNSQEQAVSSWITFLNLQRLDKYIDKLMEQDLNLKEALKELSLLKDFLGDPNTILGSDLTKHGEIAEHFQVRIANARRAVKGLFKNHTFDGVGRTAPEDYIRDGKQVQSKFYNGLRNTFFSKNAIQKHLEKYPDFVNNGGSYDIPKDQYEYLTKLLETYENNPSQLSSSDYKLAQSIDKFLKEKELVVGKDITPSVAEYNEVQKATASSTVEKEEASIKEEDKKQREKAYNESKPTLKEGIKVAGIAAAVEGGLGFCLSVARKRKDKKFSEFSKDDWKEIGIDTAYDGFKGGIRGGTIYGLTNFTAMPSNVANAYITAAFGVYSQINEYKSGNISEEDFVINCEVVCLDVAISTISAVAGQMVIPIPVLGSIVGSIVGEYVYGFCKKEGDERTKETITQYHLELKNITEQLEEKLLEVMAEIQKSLDRFEDLEKLAFDVEINKAFEGSILLAEEVGVPFNDILKTKEDIDIYFLGKI